MNMQLLESILTAYGATSREDGVRAVIAKALEGHVDSLTTDVMGNLIAVRKGDGTGRRIMLSSHMDHIGLIVMDAEKKGFLRVCNVGGIRPANMIGQQVVFENGAAGVFFADENEKSPEIRHLYIDVGAESREEALAIAPIGEIAVYAPSVKKLGEHRLSSPAMDDRIACFIQVQMLLDLPRQVKNEIVAVFSVQEEVGLRGAQTAAFAAEPDMGIALDVTGVGDIPGHENHVPMALGKGAAVKIMDRSLICTSAVVDLMLDTAKENGIMVQREVLPYGGTDAGAIQKTRGGVPSGVISIPCRYIHSAAETVDIRDVQAAYELLLAVVQK